MPYGNGKKKQGFRVGKAELDKKPTKYIVPLYILY